MVRFALGCAVAAALVLPLSASADADGPDYYSVIDVAADDVLNMRASPSASAAKIGAIPHDAEGVANLGCVGGLSFEDWQNATEEARAASLKTRWCLVGYDRQVGWSAGWFLSEGAQVDGYNAGGHLGSLAGSEWRLVMLGDATPPRDATLAFGSDGAMGGLAGCNRMTGSYAHDREALTFGPIAATRKLCPEEFMTLEQEMLAMLSETERVVAHHLVLVLLDGTDTVRARFARLDFD